MNIESFLLCDAATQQQGKLNVLGAFDTIFTEQTPAVHPACAIAARIRFEKIEEGDHLVKIGIIDEDGKSIGPKLQANANVRFEDNVDSTATNLILNIQGLQLEKHGQYRIDLAIDNQIKGSLPLYVREAPNQT
jgi:hypothetical protein